MIQNAVTSVAISSVRTKRCEKRALMVCEQSLPSVATRHDTAYDLNVGNLVIRVVSTLEQVDIDDMIRTSRGKADICLARQMAMYLMHTVFSCPYHRVAAFFGRDRTTIAHACRLIEDARDDRDFDTRLEVMENLLVSARSLSDWAAGEGDHNDH